MNTIDERLTWLKVQIDKRTLRERGLIFIALMTIIFAFWKAFIFDKIFGSQESLTQNLKVMERTIQQLQGQLTDVSRDIRSDPITKLQQEIRAVDVQNKRLDNQLAELTKQLIPPVEMTHLLQGMILEKEGIEFIRIENLPEIPLFSQEQIQGNEADIAKFQVYKHPLLIEFKANYQNTRAFIQELEALPWNIRWDEFNYQVEAYPYATVKIVVETLSLDKSWISA